MGNAAGSVEVPQGTQGSPGGRTRTKGLKLPMPPEEELEQRFGAALVSFCLNFDTEERRSVRRVDRNRGMWNMLEMCTS